MLDVRTEIAIAAVLSAVTGASLLYVLRDYPAQFAPSIRRWTAGVLLQAVAWSLYCLQNTAPLWLTTVGAGTVLVWAMANHCQGVRLFVGRPLGPWRFWGPVAAAALIETVFCLLVPDGRANVVLFSSIFVVQAIWACAALFRPGPLRDRSHVLTGAMFATLAVVMGARVVYEGLRHGSLPSLIANSPMQILVFALSAAASSVASLGFMLMCNDRLNRELEWYATIDTLTGINNRRTLGERAAFAIAAAHRLRRPLSLMLVDADHFKRVNDVYGHAAGDEALQMIAAALQSTLRGGDLLGRLGGEEFVVVLPDTDETAARGTAERLRAAVEDIEFALQHRRIELRVSVGLAVIDDHDDFSELLRRADQAMYAAKRAGRNCVCGPSDLTQGPVVVAANFGESADAGRRPL